MFGPGEQSKRLRASSDPSAGLHEGYFQFGTADNKTLWARVGRQEYDHNQGRFFWRAGWAIPGRAFDAIRIHNESGNLSGDLVGMVWKNAENHSETECIDDDNSETVVGSEALLHYKKPQPVNPLEIWSLWQLVKPKYRIS